MDRKPTYQELERKISALEDESAGWRREAEALRESEKKYRLLIENAGEAVFVAQEGIVRFANARAEAMIGVNWDQGSTPFTEFIHPDDREMVLDRHIRRLRGEEFPSRYSFRILSRSTGGIRWVELTVVMIQWEGKPATLNFLSDITERRQAEEALRLSEERFRLAFQTSPDAINMNRLRDGLYMAINEGFTSLAGYSWEDVKGKTSLEIDIWADPSQRQKLVEGLRSNGKVTNLEASFRMKDGSVRTGIMSARVILLDKEPHILSVTRDVDEFKRTQLALEKSEAGYRQLFENMSDIAFVCDPDGRVISVNPAATRILKRSENELVGKYLMDLVTDEDKRTFREKLERATKGPSEGTVVVVSGEGRRCILDYRSTVVHSHDGRKVVSGMARDVTERVEAEKKLRFLQAQLNQAQKMESVGRLAGGVAHDFNNMLQAIIGHAEVAAMNEAGRSPFRHHLNAILDSAQRSASVVRQLLAFARKETVAPKVLDLNHTISTTLKMLGRLIGEDIDLIWAPDQDLWNVKIDPSQVDQVLANLVVNARDAITETGKVTIETHNVLLDSAYCGSHPGFSPGEYVLLAVSDNGVGMTADILEHLFEPFFTTKDQGKGTGLGLSTVHGVVMQNNGFINVYTEPGRGTTFKVYLPRSRAGASGAEGKAEAERVQGGTETVLIVEDEGSILEICREILKRLGYTVLCAGAPNQAITLAREHTGDIHLLITDLVMPEINGRELATRVAAVKPGLKCLYMSGYTANVVAGHGLIEENVLFLPKPFSIRTLAAKVREALEAP